MALVCRLRFEPALYADTSELLEKLEKMFPRYLYYHACHEQMTEQDLL